MSSEDEYEYGSDEEYDYGSEEDQDEGAIEIENAFYEADGVLILNASLADYFK
jgi:hypothetical protein